MHLFPGDQLWNRYRVERVVHGAVAGVLLSALDVEQRKAIGSHAVQDTATTENVQPLGLFRCGFQYARTNKHTEESSQFFLVPLENLVADPLSAFLCFFGSKLHGRNSSMIPQEMTRKGRRKLSDACFPVTRLPLLGQVEWIGEPQRGGCAILAAPAALSLSSFIRITGFLKPEQALAVMTQLAGSLDECFKIANERGINSGELSRLLVRLLHPEALSIRTKDAQLILRPQLAGTAPNLCPPAWTEYVAPELFRDASEGFSACVFGVARVAAFCMGIIPKPGISEGGAVLSAESAWAQMAAWVSGQRDPAREFLNNPQAKGLPPEFSQLLARCLARKPSRRVPSISRLLSLLKPMADLDWAQSTVCADCGFKLPVSVQPPRSATVAMARDAVEAASRRDAGAPETNSRSCPCCGRDHAFSSGAFSGPGTAKTTVSDGMTLIPAGSFLSGDRKVPRTLRAFAIDTTPVTESGYKKFLAATGKQPRGGGAGTRPPRFDRHPVTHVTWYEANEFAEHYGKRLPTIYEWEKAARGIDGRKFPCGNTYKSGCGQLRSSAEAVGGKIQQEQATVPVGTHAEGASPYGILDMAGNVLEWTSSARRSGERIFRAVKGASYLDGSPELARCTGIQYIPPEHNEPHVGFRCVRDME